MEKYKLVWTKQVLNYVELFIGRKNVGDLAAGQVQVSRRDKSAAKQTRELVERGNRSTFVTAGGFLENEE